MATFSITNSTGLTIADLSQQSQTIDVYGTQGTITDVNFNLNNLTHSFSGDLDMLVVGPAPINNLEFWSDAGGESSASGSYTIDDSSAVALPFGTPAAVLAAGSYLPGEYGAGKDLEADIDFNSATGGINHAATNGSATFASAFNGIAANGTWTYYLADDFPGRTGTLGGWGLTVTTNSAFVQIDGTAGADTISVASNGAGSGSYALNSLSVVGFSAVVSLTLNGQGGNDGLQGSAGLESAAYSGARGDYAVNGLGAGFIVQDLRPSSPEGTDTLAGIDRLICNDGSITLELTAQGYRTRSYDTLGRLDSQRQIGSDGTVIFTDLDEANANPWVRAIYGYDAQGSIDTFVLLNDNSTSSVTDYDQNNASTWARSVFNYDTQARLDRFDLFKDDGSYSVVDYDQAGTNTWARSVFTYDRQGRLDRFDLFNDDNSYSVTDFDQANANTWARSVFNYDTQARLDTFLLFNDNNSYSTTDYDQTDTSNIAFVTYNYNPAGQLTQAYTQYDDGTGMVA